MDSLKLLITTPPHPPALAALKADPSLEITLVDEPVGGHGLGSIDWPIAWLREAEVLFCSGVLPANFDQMKRVRWVQLASAGYEQAIEQGLADRGVRVCNANGVFDIAIAEWNIGMIIALTRDLRGMIRNQATATWDRDRRFQREVRGSTVGFWGYGGLSRETARIAKAMGLKVHVLVRGGVKKRHHYLVPGTGDPEGVLPDRVFAIEEKEAFLRGLDFLIVAMPQTPATIGMIGEAELRLLPRHACLLNPARGPLVREEALLKALREGWIAGAALDTHYHYPMPPEHPLWKFPNVIMTPHISGSGETQHYLPRAWDVFTRNLASYRAGRPLINELTPGQLRGE